jgi:hypothetical protein
MLHDAFFCESKARASFKSVDQGKDETWPKFIRPTFFMCGTAVTQIRVR